MAEIPDDVVERARAIYLEKYLTSPHIDAMRAALRVGVEWEREQCAMIVEENAKACEPDRGYFAVLQSNATAIRARTNPDDRNPPDYT
jgi:hypothetical protein